MQAVQVLVTFGAVACSKKQPQGFGSAQIDKGHVVERLRKSLDRRPDGVVLVSTRSQDHLTDLVKTSFGAKAAEPVA